MNIREAAMAINLGAPHGNETTDYQSSGMVALSGMRQAGGQLSLSLRDVRGVVLLPGMQGTPLSTIRNAFLAHFIENWHEPWLVAIAIAIKTALVLYK